MWIGVGGEVSTNPFLISLNANLLPLLSLFYVLQQEIKFLTLRKQRNDHRSSNVQLFNCRNSCRANPSLASSVDVHQIKSSRMQITRWHRVGGATNQSNRSLAFTVTASVTVAICLRPIIGKHKQYLDLRDSSRSNLVMASLKQR